MGNNNPSPQSVEEQRKAALDRIIDETSLYLQGTKVIRLSELVELEGYTIKKIFHSEIYAQDEDSASYSLYAMTDKGLVLLTNDGLYEGVEVIPGSGIRVHFANGKTDTLELYWLSETMPDESNPYYRHGSMGTYSRPNLERAVDAGVALFGLLGYADAYQEEYDKRFKEHQKKQLQKEVERTREQLKKLEEDAKQKGITV